MYSYMYSKIESRNRESRQSTSEVSEAHSLVTNNLLNNWINLRYNFNYFLCIIIIEINAFNLFFSAVNILPLNHQLQKIIMAMNIILMNLLQNYYLLHYLLHIIYYLL